jgi:hypothetical protein
VPSATPTPVALAIRNSEFQAGRIFSPDAIMALRPSLAPIMWPWVAVARRAEQHGLRLCTADQVDDPRRTLLIAYDWPPQTEHLLAAGARPAMLTTLEPPVIAWRLYADLPRLSARFPHALVFRGAANRLAPGCAFHELRFPLPPEPQAAPPPPWAGRPGYLAMVNSNKVLVRSPRRFFDRPREFSLKRELAAWRFPAIGRDLYGERLRAIRFFATRPGFDLYGEGWSDRHPAVDPRTHALAQRAWRGSVPDKHALLRGYRFALVIENCRFPGYVSEKLFECLRAGAIPVYLGAPDVERYVPRDAFVDLGRFAGYEALDDYLRALAPAAAEGYLEAGAAYLCSAAYAEFSGESFARQIVDVLLRVKGG